MVARVRRMKLLGTSLETMTVDEAVEYIKRSGWTEIDGMKFTEKALVEALR